MVANTPNRGYPYPTSGDPGRVPEAIQALAEAIDLDMQNLDDSILRRPIAMVSYRSTTAQVFPADVVTEATYDFVHIDTAGISNLAAFPTRLTPTSPGLWFCWASIEGPGSFMRTKDQFVRVNGGDLNRQSFHVNPTPGTTMLSTCGMALMNGTTDYFTQTFEPDLASDDFKIKVKRLGCFRLTAA
jgi:hypothetical protein